MYLNELSFSNWNLPKTIIGPVLQVFVNYQLNYILFNCLNYLLNEYAQKPW